MTFGGAPGPAALVIDIEGREVAFGASRTVTLPADGAVGPRTVTVNIPAGVADGTLLRLPGLGAAGPNGEPGDAFVRIRITNPVQAPPAFGAPVSGPGFSAPVSGPGPVSGPPGYGAPPPFGAQPGQPAFGDQAGPPAGQDYNVPNYGAPTSGVPSHGAPTSGVPSYGPPTSGVPSYGPPTSVAPNFGPPGSGAPNYGPPISGVPNYGGPGYGGPGYGTPNYGPGGGQLGYPIPPPTAKPIWRNPGVIVAAAVVVVLLLCGGVVAIVATSGDHKKTTAGSSPTAGADSPTASPSPTPVSEADYQTALAALDHAILPGFQQLHGARTPATVSAAINTLSSGLSAQLDELQSMTPPAAVADANQTLVQALTQFSSDVQAAAGAAAGQQVCAGSSALSMISRSAGAAQLRTVAKTLSTADAANPYKVATFLPGPIAPVNRRPANGTYVKSPAHRGIGKLQVTNGGSTDAAVSLVPSRGGKAVLTVYIRAKASFTAGRIADGTYSIYVAGGSDYDGSTHTFTRSCDFSKFESPAFYTTTSSTFTRYTLTLTPVSGGNAAMDDVDPGQFPG